jgi:acyl carrier protein
MLLLFYNVQVFRPESNGRDTFLPVAYLFRRDTTAMNNTQEDVFQTISKIIIEQIDEEVTLTPETNIYDDLAVDSIELVEISVKLEKIFAVSLPFSELRNCITLLDLVNTITRAKQENKIDA